MLEFKVAGMWHQDHKPNEIHFCDGIGPSSSVRLLLKAYEGHRWIEAIELVPLNQPSRIQSLPANNEDSGGIAEPDWGGRHDMDAGLWIDWTYEPGEWNDCGRRDDYWRQCLCRMEDVGMNYAGFIVTCVLLGVIVFVVFGFVCWRYCCLSQMSPRTRDRDHEERDALLLAGDEDLDEDDLEKGGRGSTEV